MNKKKVSTERVIAAIPGTGGIISEIAKRCGVNRNTITNYAKDNPEIQAAIEQETDTFCDVAENSLLTLVREKNVSAVIFYLKTKGRHRGYTERMEVQAVRPIPIVISPEEAEYFDDETIKNVV